MDAELRLIHEPARLRLMGLLYKHREVRFSAARDALGLTDGNIATHARRLQEAGCLEATRVLRQGIELRYRITPEGSRAFRRYLETMRHFIEDVRPVDPSG